MNNKLKERGKPSIYANLFIYLFLQTVKRSRKIQIPATTKPKRAVSQSNLLDQDYPRRTRRFSDSSDPRDADRYRSKPRSTTPDRNGYGNNSPTLVSSSYKRLPKSTASDKPIKTTLIKKKTTDGKE